MSMPVLTEREIRILMFASGLFMGFVGAHVHVLLAGAIGILIIMFILRNE